MCVGNPSPATRRRLRLCTRGGGGGRAVGADGAAIAIERSYVVPGIVLIALVGAVLALYVLCANVSKYELLCESESIEGRSALTCAEECGDVCTAVHDIFSPCLPCLCPDCKTPRLKQSYLRMMAEDRQRRPLPADAAPQGQTMRRVV